MKDKEIKKIYCDSHLGEISGEKTPFNYFHSEDSILKKMIEERGGKKHNPDYYLLCGQCTMDYRKRMFLVDVENLRQKKCDICENFLLKDKFLFTLYYLVYKELEVDKEEKWKLEIEKTICWKCWDANKYLTVGKYWKKIIINPEERLVLDKNNERLEYLKLI